jgi:hypothetical protein
MNPYEAMIREVDWTEWYSNPRGWELTPEGAWDRLVDAAGRAGYKIVLEPLDTQGSVE